MAVPHPHQRAIRTVACLALAAGLVLAGACTRPPDRGGDGEPEGKVTIACGATEEWCAAMKSGFTKATGIPADYVRLSSGEALARLKGRKDNPEFDVWHGGPADGYVAAGEQGLLDPYISPKAAAIPSRYKDSVGVWTGVHVGVLGFCSNTKVLAEKKLAVPRSWQDLLNPGLRTSVGIAHPSTSGTAYTVLWTQVLLRGSADGALDYMRQLHPNVLNYSKSGSAPVQQAAKGEVAIGVAFSHDCVAAKEAGNRDLEVSFPAEGAGYETGGIALVKGAPNPTHARQFVDWALSPTAQELGPSARSYQVSTHPEVKKHGPRRTPLRVGSVFPRRGRAEAA